MEEISVKKQCKHGLTEDTCSLCLGYPQMAAPLIAGGLPSWWTNSTQFALRTKYAGEAWKGGPALVYFAGRGSRQDTKS